MLRQLAVILLAGLVTTSPALAKNNKNQGQGDADSVGEVLLDVAITAAEIAIIYDFISEYGTAPFGPPQGLPPGIAKNLARGKPLPPGIAKRYLPQNLLAQLPRPGYEWLVVDNDILLVVAATSIIVDVLQDAF
ncbi:MAG TPA: anti-virulence regulator CigR family protein [Kiloniellales bacterium]|nr:anti-virulence regulator CigR family protein [Kiloniellales bacterium]